MIEFRDQIHVVGWQVPDKVLNCVIASVVFDLLLCGSEVFHRIRRMTRYLGCNLLVHNYLQGHLSFCPKKSRDLLKDAGTEPVFKIGIPNVKVTTNI